MLLDSNTFKLATQYYGTTARRNREPYILHCLRVAEDLTYLSTSSNNLCLLGLFHDALEISPNLPTEPLEKLLGQEAFESLLVLTRKDDESSEEHFNRVLTSGRKHALLGKYYDCKDNTFFTESDCLFTRYTLGLDPYKEQLKYYHRMVALEAALKDLGLQLRFR